MYERFYQLRERPFALSPDPDYLYPSRVHQEALDYLRFGIEGHAGFVVITGEIGSGKTTLLQVLLRSLDGNTTVIRLVNTLLTGPELLESLLLDLGVADPPPTKPLMLRELARLLIEERARGRRVVAIIDEAQNLPLEALEELRMLSNLETEKSKLIQIVLVGQPGLRDTLERPTLEQLRQRVTVRYHLDPLDAHDTTEYINHRLRRAATSAPLHFPRDVSDAVHARSGGIPRMINAICDAVLLCGYAEESRVINMPLVRTAIEELEASSVLRRSAGASSAASAAPAVAQSAPRPSLVAAPPPSASGAAAPRSMAADLPLASRPAAAAGFADIPLRVAETRPRQAASARPSAKRHDVVARPPAAPMTVAHVRAAPPRPAVSKPEPRPAGAWGWLKDVLFGAGPEAERR
jgi:putative secretion ATPase (PEP-CTERM system associated)